MINKPDLLIFLWCSFPDPHHPVAATAPYSEMYDPSELTLSETFDMRGHHAADSLTLPGRSLRPFLDEGENLPPKPARVEYDEDWFPDAPFFRIRTLVDERYKLVVYASPGGGQLFDLQNDPHEVSNLWNDPAYAAAKAELMEQALRGFCRNDRLDQPRRSGA